MKKLLMAAALWFCGFQLAAQQDSLLKPLSAYADYQPAKEKKFGLKHTRLEVRFDFDKREMPGKAWITLSPWFYPENMLVLDAKSMLIHEVALWKNNAKAPLAFSYADSMKLIITLDKTYQPTDELTVFVDYTARPESRSFAGSQAISDAKGLYFINHDGSDSTKPRQVWTQGETEATSVWCPTIDAPNQKTTQEIAMTVPENYVSLSNGVLQRQQQNTDGTRTDYWKMDKPHAPYLFFMGAGDFAVVQDKWRGIAVDYYVDRNQEANARALLGETPAMMEFFSKLLNYDYPWSKYAQMMAHDYVSGAMENTTATLHSAMAYQNNRQLKDENFWEPTIAHELFHHWFGDLVTTESFSNLAMNESFADMSEVLWNEHRYGKDNGLLYNRNAMQSYFNSPNANRKDLVRFRYHDKEDMFDVVSYQKGGRILLMLRNYLGDSAFYSGLNHYLKKHEYGTAEAHDLRIAMEDVSGKDLNWFFNQWFYGSGHPVVKVSRNYNADEGIQQIIIEQTQPGKWFNIPVDMDVYSGGEVTSVRHWLGARNDTISIISAAEPDWVDLDPARFLLWQKTETGHSGNLRFRMQHATNAVQKLEFLDELNDSSISLVDRNEVITGLLNDEYYGVRRAAMDWLLVQQTTLSASQWKALEFSMRSEEDNLTKASALRLLGRNNAYKNVAELERLAKDSSYAIASAALENLVRLQSKSALALAPQLKNGAQGKLLGTLMLTDYLSQQKTTDEILQDFQRSEIMSRLPKSNVLLYAANNAKNFEDFRKLVDNGAFLIRMLPMDFWGYKSGLQGTLNWMIDQRKAILKRNPKDAKAQQELDYLLTKI